MATPIYTKVTVHTRYRTEDGRWCDSEAEANAWHRNLRERFEMNAMLNNGATLASIAERFPYWYADGVCGGVYDVPEALRDVTASHRFVISYWQCCDTPAYQIRRSNADGTVFVGGNGGWSGFYGNDLGLRDLARFPAHPADPKENA